ncbi:DNA mismatch repair protein [Vibrionales bacterium C3R12]|nr:DNA mismatch repair protein [Vibrionales bacterium C3R12]
MRIPPAWVIVLFGLILNILAIITSSLVLDKQSAELAQLAEQKESNMYSIQLSWNSIETLERKRESILLHVDKTDLESAFTSSVLDEVLRGQLAVWAGKEVPKISIENLSEIMTLINLAQQTQRDRIDDFYLDNVAVAELMQVTSDNMAFYKNIALFLQIFGLALILARDLARKPNATQLLDHHDKK